MTLKGAGANQACAACKYQRKRCTPECVLAPHFRPENPMVFRNAHKLFGVRNILRILEQINPNHMTDAMRTIIYEANMRDMFPVNGCLNVISELQYQIKQAEEEFYSVLARLAFYKQHHERHYVTTLSSSIAHGLQETDYNHNRVTTTTSLPISSCENANVCTNALWLQETYKPSNFDHNHLVSRPLIIEEEAIRDQDEIYPLTLRKTRD